MFEMLLPINNAGRFLATCPRTTARLLGRIALPIILIACSAAVLAAPAAPANAAEPSRVVAERNDLPDAADVVSAYLTARRWIDAFELPALDSPDSRLHIGEATGVCVHLRRSGRVLGSAAIAPTRHLDDDLKLRRTLGRAMSHVLGDSAVSQLPDDMRDKVGRSLVLELEVAGPPEPLIAQSFRQVARQIEPGVHGVALRRGDRWAMLFPSELLATNGADRIATRLAALTEELGVSAADLASLVADHNISVYRFRTSHMVQTGPDKLPHEAFRGSQLVPQSEVDRASIADAADALVQHVLARLWPNAQHPDRHGDIDLETAPAMLGDYRLVADRFDPLIAPPFEQALTAFALARYARSPNADEDAAESARQAAEHILEKLAGDRSFALSNPTAAAAVVYATTELGEGLDQLRREATELLDHAFDGRAFRAIARNGASQVLPSHIQAICAGAVVRAVVARDKPLEEATAARLREMLDAIWEAAPEHEHVGLLPWLGWAERELAGATDHKIAHSDLLRQMRSALYEVQVGAGETEDHRRVAPDLHGGFVLAGHRRPDSQSIRPMIWLAAMMRESALTDEADHAEHRERLLAMARYLMQLTVRESAIWSLRNPERALGGVRNAMWDSDQPLAAQAVALLAFSEILETLHDEPPADGQ